MLKRKPKKRRIPNPLKVSTRSAVKKGPARSDDHLAMVRRMPCVICRLCGTPAAHCGPSEAHHARELFPRTMGVRISDYLTVSLCTQHHTDFHKTNNISWWRGWAMPGFPLTIMTTRLENNYPAGLNADADAAKAIITARVAELTDGAPANPAKDRAP